MNGSCNVSFQTTGPWILPRSAVLFNRPRHVLSKGDEQDGNHWKAFDFESGFESESYNVFIDSRPTRAPGSATVIRAPKATMPNGDKREENMTDSGLTIVSLSPFNPDLTWYQWRKVQLVGVQNHRWLAAFQRQAGKVNTPTLHSAHPAMHLGLPCKSPSRLLLHDDG